jgi:hypothetical protein
MKQQANLKSEEVARRRDDSRRSAAATRISRTEVLGFV